MELSADFNETRAWSAALNQRTSILSEPAVYALLHESTFGRLRGASRILYIGSTGQFGGASSSCRLRIYRYPNGHHAKEMQRRIQLLHSAGILVTLHWMHVASKTDASKLEASLLRNYVGEHLELPPFNGRSEGRG